MAGNRKPARRHKPKSIYVPMMKSTHDDLALEMHLAVEALVGAPGPATYNQLSKMLRVMNSIGVDDPALVRANNTMLAIADRCDRVHKVGVSAAEADFLRQDIATLETLLRTVPVNRFVAAVNKVAAFCAEMGV